MSSPPNLYLLTLLLLLLLTLTSFSSASSTSTTTSSTSSSFVDIHGLPVLQRAVRPAPLLRPKAPKLLPSDWYTWMIVSVTEDNNTTPLFLKGQFLAYSASENYSCRYNEQNLLLTGKNADKKRPADFCDYAASFHYALNDTVADQGIECAGQYPLPKGDLPQMAWPRQMTRGNFLSVDRVGQLNCNHFVTFGVPIAGGKYQVDVWVNEDDDTIPCQISMFEQGKQIHYTWAFDGFRTVIPDEARACTSPRLVCSRKDWTCQAKRNSTQDDVGAALQWVCDPSRVDCDPVNPGGAHFLPNNVYDHADWAFNNWYERMKFTEGELACYFSGNGHLVPPNTPSPTPKSQRGVNVSRVSRKRDFLSAIVQFQTDFLCDVNPPGNWANYTAPPP